MSDRNGLSIFDNEPASEPGEEATQVIPAATAGPAPAARAGSTQRTTFPVVRRGGYDPAAVDRQFHTIAGEKAGLSASLQEAKVRVAANDPMLWSYTKAQARYSGSQFAAYCRCGTATAGAGGASVQKSSVL